MVAGQRICDPGRGLASTTKNFGVSQTEDGCRGQHADICVLDTGSVARSDMQRILAAGQRICGPDRRFWLRDKGFVAQTDDSGCQAEELWLRHTILVARRRICDPDRRFWLPDKGFVLILIVCRACPGGQLGGPGSQRRSSGSPSAGRAGASELLKI